MKRFFSLYICLFLLFPAVSMAEGKGNIWTEVMRAVVEERWGDAEKLFKAAIGQNKDEAENFFWRERVNNSFRETMALNLGDYYRKLHNHEKAFTFYNELIKLRPQDLEYLAGMAELQVCCGKEKEALDTYEKILSLAPDNLPANIYIGNYYFFYAEKSKKKLDEDYSRLVSPTRMQLAAYHNGLATLLNSEYFRSKKYLEKVMALFPSTEVKKTLDRIKQVETEINK